MLRVGFVLRSTEIQPACFRFVPFLLHNRGVLRFSACTAGNPDPRLPEVSEKLQGTAGDPDPRLPEVSGKLRAWLIRRRAWLISQRAWLIRRRAWVISQRAWVISRRAWLISRRAWLISQRAWLISRPAGAGIRRSSYITVGFYVDTSVSNS